MLLRSPIPHGHWKTTTFIAALRNSGMVAPMVLDGPINGVAFQAYVDQILVPELNAGQLSWLLRAKYLAPAEGLNKIQGRPFLVSEIEAAIEKMLG